MQKCLEKENRIASYNSNSRVSSLICNKNDASHMQPCLPRRMEHWGEWGVVISQVFLGVQTDPFAPCSPCAFRMVHRFRQLDAKVLLSQIGLGNVILSGKAGAVP